MQWTGSALSPGTNSLQGGTEERSEGGGGRSTGRCQSGEGTTVSDDDDVP